MLCFMDRTYCADFDHRCANVDCSRALVQSEAIRALAWTREFDSAAIEAQVAYSHFFDCCDRRIPTAVEVRRAARETAAEADRIEHLRDRIADMNEARRRETKEPDA